MVSVLGSLILVLVLAATVLLVRPGPVEGWLGAKPSPSVTASPAPDPAPSPVLAAADTAALTPSSAGVKRAIAGLVAAPALGSSVGISVVDAISGESLFAQNATAVKTPASTTKLITAATVLAARGPAHRLTTRVVAGPEPGEIVLVGGGDPTLAVSGKALFPGAARLDDLAGQVRRAAAGTPVKRVLVDTSLFSGPFVAQGWDPGIIAPEGQVSAIQPLMTDGGRTQPVNREIGGEDRFPDPALAAGRAFAKLLKLSTATVARGKAPAGAAELGSVRSPPLVHLVDWMLEQSENTIADALARQVALAAGLPATFDGAATAMSRKLAELGLNTRGLVLKDGSGLSRLNRISPGLLTGVLTVAAGGKQARLSRLFTGLPVAGWSGTLRTRFAAEQASRAGQGLVRAKTGSLSGINTVAGQLVTKDGRLLVFALMADRTGDSLAARAALDRIATRLTQCGC